MFNLELVGVYSLNFRLVTTFFILFTTISSVFNPWFGKYYGENDIKRVAKGVKVCLLTTTIGSALIFIFVSLFGKDIMNVWLGKPEYFDKGIIFSLCAYGMSLSVVHTSMALASATGSIKKLPYIAFFEAIANLFFSLILSYYFGVFGVALGTFFAALVTTFWMIPYFCLKPIFKDTWNLFLPAMKHFLFINLPVIVTVIILITCFDTQRYLLLYKNLILMIFIASNGFVLLSILKKNKTLLRSEV
jgi:Na+-driven multidrug efflux pump